MDALTTLLTEAADDVGGMTLEKWTRIAVEIENQPLWRARADREADYYDGNQLDSATLRAMAERGLPPAIEPLIGAHIDMILGMEAKNRMDWRVMPDGDKTGDDVADAMNYKVNQAERRSGADRACSDAYASQVKVGIGWAEVARERDPFKYPYRVQVVHRNEIFWDMLSKKPDLTDARYLVRRKWTDMEQAVLMFPHHKELIKGATSGWQGFDSAMLTNDGGSATDLAMSQVIERGWAIEDQEWRDMDFSRVCLYEVWYQTWEETLVFRTVDGRVVEFDMNNPDHLLGASLGVPLEKHVISRMNLAWYLGPHKLHDGPSPYTHNKFPYVPFWGKKEDRTGVPYGLIRAMVYLQDEVNARISKMQWLLSSVTTIRTEGAVKGEDSAFRQMVARPNADIVLDAEAMKKEGATFEIQRNQELNAQQYQRLIDLRDSLKKVIGLTQGMEGDNAGMQSGAGFGQMVEQGVQALADINDNFQFSRAAVGDLLLSLIIEDSMEESIRVLISGNAVKDDREVILNQPMYDENLGTTVLDNDVQRTKLMVVMSDVPSTPSFRTQQLQSMSEAFKSMPDDYQSIALPHLLNLMDIPDKEDIISQIKELKEQTSEEDIEARIDEAVKQAIFEKQFELKEREIEMKEQKTNSEIQKIISETINNTLTSFYSATQAGIQLAEAPGVAPIADELLASAGFEDKNNPPIFMGTGGAGADVTPETEVPMNTSPQFPPRAQDAVPEEVAETGAQPPVEPDVGVGTGIEKPGFQG